jgi:3-dehydroquinate synthase
MERIQVSDYDILLGSIGESISQVLKSFNDSSIFILTDENTHTLCLPLIEPYLNGKKYHVYKIPAGEVNKNIATCLKVWSAMTDARLDRHSLMINLGGGVITDLGGFCASTYKRGISFIQVPTTLLSQVDASIGGKLGIDFEGYKNHIGVFRFPHAVLIDPMFLNTLSDRELKSGYAEIIKHALIADGEDWQNLSQIKNLRSQDWAKIIRRSLEVKRKIVIADPYEKNERKLLNFGHTIGHAIESQYLQTANPLLHGEAIAAGMIYETMLSKKYLKLSEETASQIINYITEIYGDPVDLEWDKIMTIMKQDKKNSNNKISFSLLEDIGVSKWDILLSDVELIATL